MYIIYIDNEIIDNLLFKDKIYNHFLFLFLLMQFTQTKTKLVYCCFECIFL